MHAKPGEDRTKAEDDLHTESEEMLTRTNEMYTKD